MKKVTRFLLCAVFSLMIMRAAPALFAGTAPVLEFLDPGQGAEVPFGVAPVIAVSIFDPDGDVDATTVEIKVDTNDVTDLANVSAFLVTYSFPGTVPAGRRTFTVSVNDLEGNEATLSSYFFVSPEPKKERKATANGSVRAGAEYIKESDQNTVGVLDASFYGRLGESVDYSFDMLLTNEDSSDGQRVSSYRLGLSTPIGGLVLGDATPSFTTYSIDGQELFGVHLLPQFGWFGMELIYGQTFRAVDDPDTYRQRAWGGKIKFGNPRSAQWGLALLNVKDDTDSISSPVPPRENIILGTDLSLSLFGGVLQLDAEANESLLNTDISGGAYDFTGNELPFDPDDWDWLFTINDHVRPPVPGLSSLAGRVAARIGPTRDNTFYAEYSYVGTSYFSLANPAIVTDRAGVKAWDSLWLLQRKLFFNVGFQYYWDNLEDYKPDTLKNLGVSGVAYMYPNDLWTVNAGTDVQKADDGNLVDTLNTTINGGVSRRIELFSTSSSAFLNGSASLYRNDATGGTDVDKYTSRLGASSYFNAIPLDTKAVVGLDFGDVDTSVYLEGRAGFRFLKDQALYAYTDIIYETGIEQLDWEAGADYAAPFGVAFEANFEYISLPGTSDVILSAYATYRF